MARTIILHTDKDFRVASLSAVLAHFATWGGGVPGYDTVNVYDDGKDDLTAVFSDSKSEARFVMGAVWRHDEGRYTFHS